MRCIEIRYGIAFFYDHGDMGMYDHLGDSEMYAMVLRRTASWADSRSNQNRWALVRDYTSALDGTIQDPNGCGEYDVWSGDDFGSSSDCAGKFQRNIPWAL